MKNDRSYVSRAEILLVGAKKKPVMKYMPRRRDKKKGKARRKG